ncbi:hypothetical protein Ahy_A05g023277 [Arachis hypogaea]|uniref:Aminotransferase-like plant mobile domain-containing protein n=1 Tax=Arachis hypogaea TaxID=3818 RepID=A0A445D3G9_ARAHY|nr:hypothetical protein Ahy_A05g023277 [Arachis hypogaea]
MTVHFTWFHEKFRLLPVDATEDTVCIYAHAYIMMFLSTQLFGDKSANRVHIRWLSFVANHDDMGNYSWGTAALAWLYRCMCRVVNRNITNLSWIFWWFSPLRPHGFEDFSFPLASKWAAYLLPNDGKEQRILWEPYSTLDVLVVVHLEILMKKHCWLW